MRREHFRSGQLISYAYRYLMLSRGIDNNRSIRLYASKSRKKFFWAVRPICALLRLCPAPDRCSREWGHRERDWFSTHLAFCAPSTDAWLGFVEKYDDENSKRKKKGMTFFILRPAIQCEKEDGDEKRGGGGGVIARTRKTAEVYCSRLLATLGRRFEKYSCAR